MTLDLRTALQNLRTALQKRIEAELEEVLIVLDTRDSSHKARELLLRKKRRLEAALVRIEKGSYGICCDCEDSLSVQELEADPAAPFCSYCSAERKHSSAV